MAFVRPLIDYNGNLQEVAVGDYIQPAILGAGTPSSNTILDGSGNWVTIASLNYWTLTGSDVYRATGNVYIGSASSYGAYKLQVTGSSYFIGDSTFKSSAFYIRDEDNILELYIGEGGVTIIPPIYNAPLDGTTTLLKTVDGVITRAVSKDITDLLGDTYIKNQFSAAQSGSFWINGKGFIQTGGATPAFALYRTDAVDSTFRMSTNFVGGSYVDLNPFISGVNNGGFEIKINGTQRLVINPDGNVGVGTTSPQNKLDVSGSGRFISSLYIESSSTASSSMLRFYQTGSNWWDIENIYPGHLKFSRGGVDHAMFTNMGRLLLGTTSEYTSSILQVNGSITQRSIYNSVVYADANGQLITATAQNIRDTLGTASYIQNQYVSAQSGNYWINGIGRATEFHAQLRYTSTEIGDIKIEQESTNQKSKLSYYWYGVESASLKFNRGQDSTGGSISFWTKVTGGSYTEKVWITGSGNLGVGVDPLERLHVNGRGYFSGANTSISFARPDTARVGGIGWNSDNYFYVGGHPEYGALAGSDVRVYGFGGRLLLGTQALGDVVTFDTSGKVIIGGTSSTGSSILQIQGSVYSSTLAGSSVLLKTVSGVITRVEPGDMTNLIGDYYIRNQYSSPQAGNAWISGDFRANVSIKSGRKGFYGSYDYTEVQGIWAISENYGINTTSNTFGNQYGIAYGYEAGGPLSVDRRPLSGYGHQILFTDNGLVSAAISLTTGGAYFKSNIGIGVSNTHSRLHINGYNPRIWIQDPDATNTPYFYQELIANGTTPYLVMQVGDYVAYRNLILQNLGGKVIIGGTSDWGNYKLQVVGDLYVKDSTIHMETSAPTIRFRDTDNRGAYIHVNSSTFYILRMNDAGTSWETNSSGLWPLYINLENNNAFFGGGITQNYVKSSLVYADASGFLNIASAQNVKDLLGDGAYIKNQFASAQSGNYWIGGSAIIGPYTQSARFVVSGSHTDTTFMLYSIGNGSATGTSSISMWASEPGLTFSGCGIGGNINQSPNLGRRETAQAQSYIRFYEGHIFFSSSTTERTNPVNSPMILSNTERLLVGYGADVNSYKVQINGGSATDNGLYVNGHIRATGNIIADGYFSGTSSDRFYKSKFKKVSVYNVIDNINVYSYNHRLYNDSRLIGSVAQEIEKYFPELITKDSKGYLRVDNYGYAALALQLGKETKSEVEKLKERIKELENKLGI